jgi:hypothetical protein
MNLEGKDGQYISNIFLHINNGTANATSNGKWYEYYGAVVAYLLERQSKITRAQRI